MSRPNPFGRFFLVGLFSILMFFIGIGVRSYFAAQREWQISHETEAALLSRISLAWPEGKYIFCRYDLEHKPPSKSTCIQCMLGGKEPITDFELCSNEMQRLKKADDDRKALKRKKLFPDPKKKKKPKSPKVKK